MPRSMRRAGFAAAVLALLTAPIGAASAEWDGERATALSERLVEELEAGLDAAERAPEQTTVHQQRTRDAAVRHGREVLEAAAELRARLRSGAGRFETEGLYQGVDERMGRTIGLGRDAVPRREPMEHWKAAERTLRELGAYYQEPARNPHGAP